ncbi:MAG: fibronectin type III domain-containing protein [Verrucomicrobia bacterium]|nr:fibronectin type III domain-containing protein [Verrucomicrobiota bacterium]MDA1005789.1 fibronectin type III domain-containing protein [Verrucomicrobiota bacterium]
MKSLFFLFCLVLLHGPLQAEWFETKRHGDLVYCFFDDAGPKIEIYSLATGDWLPNLSLPTNRGTPTAAHVDADGFHIAYGTEAYRYDLNAANEVFLHSLILKATAIITNDNTIFIAGTEGFGPGGGGNMTSLSKASNAFVDIEFREVISPILIESEALIAGIEGAVRFDAAGNMELGRGYLPSPYTTEDRLWKLPARNTLIFSRNGRLVDAIEGREFGFPSAMRSGAPFADVAFLGEDVPITLSGNHRTLRAYTNTYVEAGSLELSAAAKRIFVKGNEVIVFGANDDPSARPLTTAVPLSDLNAPAPGSPPDLSITPYTPEKVFIDGGGDIHLQSRDHESLFRWNPESQLYLPGFQFQRNPVSASVFGNEVYTLYSDTKITKASLALGTPPIEVPFFENTGLFNPYSWINATGPYLATGTLSSARTLNSSGSLVDSYSSSDSLNVGTSQWNPATKRLIATIRHDGRWKTYTIGTDGTITPEGPSATGLVGNNSVFQVSRDGARIAATTGAVFDGFTFALEQASIPGGQTDLTWTSGNDLRTMRATANGTRLESWNGPGLTAGATRDLPGDPHRLLTLNDNTLLAILLNDKGIPVFYRMDTEFNIIPPPTLAAPANPTFALTHPDWGDGAIPPPGEVEITLGWDDVVGESTFRIERRVTPSGSWEEVGSTGTSITTFVEGNVTPGTTYEYRILAVNGTLESPPSPSLLVPFVAPITPSGVAFVALDDDRVEVSWIEIPNARSYRVQMRTSISNPWLTKQTAGAGQTSLIVDGLDPATTYAFRLSAANPLGESAWATGSATTLIPLPVVPHTLAAGELRAFQALIDWEGSSFDTFFLERRLPAGEWSTIYTGEESRFLDQTVTAGQLYEYRAHAENGRGRSESSSAFEVLLPDLHAPDPPSGLVLRNIEGGGVLIAWEVFFITDAVLVERRTDGPAGWTAVATVPANAPSMFLDQGVLADYKYDYRLSALNAAGASGHVTDSITVIDGECLLEGDFNNGLPSPWTTIAGGQVIMDGGKGFPSGGVLWFGGIGIRSFTTAPLDVDRGGFLQLRFRGGNAAVDGYDYWDDAEPGERVHVQYSGNGVLWSTMATLDPMVEKGWADHSLEIPWEARSMATRFRLIQESNSGPAFDTWAIDHFCLFGQRVENLPPVFAAHTPTVMSANAAGDPLILDLTPYVSDPNTPDRQFYAIESLTNPDLFSAFEIGLMDGIFRLEVAPYVAGSSEVTLRVTDEAGEAATWTITINVPALSLPVITREGPINLNLQTSLYEQSVTIANNGVRPLGGFYLRVTGLGGDYSVYGIEDGTIHYASPVAVGEAVVLQLEYYSPTLSQLPSPGFELTLFAPDPPGPVLPPTMIGAGLYRMPGGAILFEFDAIPGVAYRIQYSNDMSTWHDSPTTVTAGGNRVQWLDQGPPRTSIHPREAALRYYRAVGIGE